MVQRLYSKCNMCDKITMIKYQVGYDSFPIIYGCPNCLTEIHGKSIHNDEKLTVSFEFDNATTITSKVDRPDYFLEVSRELPTEHIRQYQESDEVSISPFMKLSRYLFSLTDDSNWKRAGHFVDTETTRTKKIFDYVKLWENKKTDILHAKLKEELPSEYFPLNNTSEIYRGLHTLFFGYISNLLPHNWMEKKQTFKKIIDVSTKNHEQFLKYAQLHEDDGFFDEIEHKLNGVLENYIIGLSGILPAYLLLDCPEIASTPEKYAMPTVSFDALLDFYQKSYETIMDAADILIGLNNINYRNDYEVLPNTSTTYSEKRKESNKFLKIKNCLLEEECFSELIVSLPHNRIRNSIGHFSTTFDPVSQIITFIDTHKGDKREEKISLIEFAYMCIANFHTCFYLLEIVYQIRKFYLIFVKGDIPFMPKPLKLDRKIGRNEPCPCGSGKKYKRCCGAPPSTL